MEITGWTYRLIDGSHQFVREFGNRTAIVTRLDGATWGFTLWGSDGTCLGGKADWNWMPEDATDAAVAYNSTIPE